MRKRIVSIAVLAAMVAGTVGSMGNATAAAKPKLLTKSITVNVKASKQIKVTKKGCKIFYKSKDSKIATVSAKGKVVGKKVGKTKINVFFKKGKSAKKKLGVVSVNVKKSGTTKPSQTVAPEVSVQPTTTPVVSVEPTSTPVVSVEPTSMPVVSVEPTSTPVVSVEPTKVPDSTPEVTPEITAEPTPEVSMEPTPTPVPTLDLNNLTTVNYPTVYSDIPDLDIIRVGGTYYMVSTTMNMCPGVPVMKSTDLTHWQIVNYVYDTFEDDDRTNLEEGKQMYTHGSWAASLKYDEATQKFYVAFNSNDHGFYVYTTDDIENGTWTRYTTTNKYHDPALFFDNGKMYVISYANLQEISLNDDKHKVEQVGKAVTLFKQPNTWSLWEGVHAYKVGEYYYLMYIASPTSRWMRTEVCYRSKTLEKGDWEEQVVYNGGCGGNGAGLAQGGIVDTYFGDWYGFLFQDHGGVGRIPSIVAVNWDYTDKNGNSYKDWPMLGTYDEDGEFHPSVAEESMQIRLTDSGLDNYIVDNDDFDYAEGDKLKLVWQWNHNPQNSFWSVTENPGYLRLKTDRIVDSIYFAHNSLTQRTYGPTCTSETKLNVANMKAGDFAGLASVSDHAGMVGVMCDESGNKFIMQAYQKFPAISNTSDIEDLDINEKVALGNATDVYVRAIYKFSSGDKVTFQYSLDGNEWDDIGSPQKMNFSTSTTFMGARSWLFNYATKEAGGYVDFDYYKIYE